MLEMQNSDFSIAIVAMENEATNGLINNVMLAFNWRVEYVNPSFLPDPDFKPEKRRPKPNGKKSRNLLDECYTLTLASREKYAGTRRVYFPSEFVDVVFVQEELFADEKIRRKIVGYYKRKVIVVFKKENDHKDLALLAQKKGTMPSRA